MTHRFSLLFFPLLMALFLVAHQTRAQTVADYRDVTEMTQAIDALDGALDGRVRVFTAGRSEQGREIKVIHLRQRQSGQLQRIRAKPAYLVECAMHAREWAAAEICMRMVEDFVDLYRVQPLLEALNISGPNTGLSDILDAVDIYVIPMVNPDGRAFDDQNGGDPFQFGPGSGWRKNRGEYPCISPPGQQTGIDLARNFSNGWDGRDASRVCADRKYRGPHPFAAKENRVLRKLVNNLLIGQSLSVHGNTQGFDRLAAPAFNSVPVQNFLTQYNALATPGLILGNGPGGGGNGQFPAWALNTADTAGQPDEGTRRGINAYMVELPVNNYAASPYRLNRPGTQNGFRPTNPTFFRDMRGPMLAGFLYMARQAANPWRPIDPITFAPAPCSGSACNSDFALVGSKIVAASSSGLVLGTRDGALRMSNTPDPHEYLRAGQYAPQVLVQNASLSGGATSRTVRFRLDRLNGPLGSSTQMIPLNGSTSRTVTLAPGESRLISGPAMPIRNGNEYRWTITLTGSDRVSLNDSHVFRFRAHR